MAAACVLILTVAATPAGAGSRYAMRGQGEPVLPSGADARALGGAEAASREPGLASNPASIAFGERSSFWGSWNTDWIRTEETLEEGVLVRKEYDGFLPNLGLVFPIPGGLRLGTGVLTERRQDGRIVQDATTPDGQGYRQTFEAKGSLLRIPAILAKDLRRLQIGGGLDVMLLNSKVRWRNDFPDGVDFLDSDDRDETAVWGVAWRAGLRVPLGRRAAVGAWGSWPSTLEGRRRLENERPQDATDNLRLDVEGETAARFGLGADVSPLAGWRVVADWVHEDWEDVATRTVGTFVDVDRVAVGVEWGAVPAGGRMRSPVRVGWRTEPLHTLDGDGREVREHAISGGSGFSFADGRGKVDWFLEYAWRGEADRSEFYEQVVRFGITLTGAEEWSGRRRPESEADDW